MLMFLPFGDWSEDGHCKYELLQIEAPSMEHLLNAENKIKEKYGEDFFEHFANEYEDSSLGQEVIEALLDIDYDFPSVGEPFFQGIKNYSFQEYIEKYSDDIKGYDLFNLEDIQDMFIKLLNAYGAEITFVPKEKQVPMICNWTCGGFKTVGYGCFWG